MTAVALKGSFVLINEVDDVVGVVNEVLDLLRDAFYWTIWKFIAAAFPANNHNAVPFSTALLTSYDT